MRPTANYLGWFNRVYRYSAAVDYAGIASNWLMQNGRWIGTQIRGQVIEESLPDGTTRVTVDLHGDNVLSFVTAGIDFRRPTVFGKQPAALVYPKAQPALGHVDLQATFINVGGGHPLPDLVQLIRQPIGPQRLESLRMVYEGDGLDNYGKPAHVTIMHDESWGPILPSHPASPSSTPPMGMATIALITAQPS